MENGLNVKEMTDWNSSKIHNSESSQQTIELFACSDSLIITLWKYDNSYSWKKSIGMQEEIIQKFFKFALFSIVKTMLQVPITASRSYEVSDYSFGLKILSIVCILRVNIILYDIFIHFYIMSFWRISIR